MSNNHIPLTNTDQMKDGAWVGIGFGSRKNRRYEWYCFHSFVEEDDKVSCSYICSITRDKTKGDTGSYSFKKNDPREDWVLYRKPYKIVSIKGVNYV